MAMSPAERAAQRRLRRWALTLEPEISAAMLRAWEIIRRTLPENEIAAILLSGSPERVVSAIANDEAMALAFTPVSAVLEKGTLVAAERAAALMPTVALRDGVGSGVQLLNPRVLEGLNTINTRALGRLQGGLRDSFLAHMRVGLEEGKGAAAIARSLRDVVGLAPNQEAAVRNFEAMLRSGDREALTRTLRDRRFDPTLRKALGRGGKGLSDDQITRMVARYRSRSIASNAATQARSAALDSYRMGQRLSWEDAFDKGLAKRERTFKIWRTVGDERVRDEHVDLEGERVPFDEPFSNGEMVPGDASYNCRCGATYVLLTQRQALAA